MKLNQLHGKQLIAGALSAESSETFFAINATNQRPLPTEFHESTAVEIDRAMQAASDSFEALSSATPDQRASLLEAIADGLAQAPDELLERCHAETALPMSRLKGELARTIGQSRLIADMIREGSWVAAKIDHADPTRRPIPKPDIRSMLVGIGPIVVIGASNFPLAISVAGTDTTTALASGCPVVVKAHPAHPGTCEMIADIICRAIDAAGFPPGIFSLVHGRSHQVGRTLVEHPETKAVAFTGSLQGGRALFDVAAARPNPIPVYAEMGSINPVFVLPDAIRERTPAIAKGFVDSINLGVGQFCTKPALLVLPVGDEADSLLKAIRDHVVVLDSAPLLHAGISEQFRKASLGISQMDGVEFIGRVVASDPSIADGHVRCSVAVVDFETFRDNEELRTELFGPFSTIVRCRNHEQMIEVAQFLDGQLTATLHGSESDLRDHRDLVQRLQNIAGRLVFNGFPTGVEVCHAVHHGGPYPAATDAHFTSIGPASIERFVRRVCFQDWPDSQLPTELQAMNTMKILRMVDGTYTRD